MSIFPKETRKTYRYLCDFVHYHSELYIYGAGRYGKCCFRFFDAKNIHINGFITTDGGEDVLGVPVYKAEEILGFLHPDSGIVLAVKSEYNDEIRKKFSFPCDVINFSQDDYAFLQEYIYLEKFFDERKYPFSKELLCTEWNNILVVQLEITFGDMIWSTGFYRELRRNFKDSHIVLVINSKMADLYRNCPYVDQIIPYECDSLLQDVSEEMQSKVNQFAKDYFSGLSFDAVFLPRLLSAGYDDNFENILIALASGAKNRIAHTLYIEEVVQYMCDLMDGWFTVVVKHTEAKHQVLQNLELLTSCGYQYEDDRMELWIDNKDKAYASFVLKDIPYDTFLIAVAMVGSTQKKSWDPCKYRTVFHRIFQKYGNKVMFLLCGGSDASEATAMISGNKKENCIDITGKTTLTEVAAVISRCDIYLGSDTGLLHMASSFSVPVIEITASNKTAPEYWEGTPIRTGPWRVDSIVLRPEKGLDECKYFCEKPYAHCINQITEDQVEEALEKMINKFMNVRRKVDCVRGSAR